MQTNKMKRNHKMKNINEMNKAELMNHIQELNDNLISKDELITELQLKLEASSKDGRKSQVLELLRKHDNISILEMSKLLGISTKNVSSQLTYLRSDGYKIFTDHKGRKVLIEDQQVNEAQQTE